MENKIRKLAKKIHPARLPELAAYLLKDEAISGKLILGATVLALIAANTPLSLAYESLWRTTLSIGLGDWALSQDLRHWINNGLMAIFFLVVGLELKRELIEDELTNYKTAILPFAAAAGGMLVPALIYMSLNAGTAGFKGWAIPVATDIAFAIGILALLGKRIPSSIRLFLLTLAIVDDIVAVIIIAVFYSNGIDLNMLVIMAVIATVLYALQKKSLLAMPVFIILGLIFWLVVNASGINPSIAGALLGLLAPVAAVSSYKKSIAERIEKYAIPVSTLFIVPLFAFANAGIIFSLSSFQHVSALPIAGGIILGLVIGKVAGIVGASWLMVKLGWSDLPPNSHWNHIIGVGFLAGIGFTISIFVTDLAFADTQLINISKFSIFLASGISAILGLFVLRFMANKKLG